ncbi:hypothetical protein PR202_ga13805 [Eleusine coracana subsp. coracana]|uniref:Uncharacterized protein n=1 Tax=Eleusine coracana subsp. coracana TaxID=191504 RepID=A0AAV5CFQ7_ELECO|nr:hypothetical protein PR202_ga13805 [Eleusine coracana subsp. coracana]
MSHCLWNNFDDNHAYHLVNWPSVTMKKEYGGLGIPDLRDLNVALLASWIRRYEESSGKLWREVIDGKYSTNRPNLFCYPVYNASRFWKGVMWAAGVAKMGYRWQVGNGKRAKFWEDVWVGTSSLVIQYWDLYVVINEQEATIDELWDG